MDLLADVLLKAPGVPMGLAARASDPKAHIVIHQLHVHGTRRSQVWSTFGERYEPGIAAVDGGELSTAWNRAKAAWWPKRWFARRAVSAQLAPFSADKRRPIASEIESLLAKLADLNQEDKALDALESEGQTLLDSESIGVDTDWSAIERYEAWAISFADVTLRIGGTDPTAIEALRAHVLPIVGEKRALLGPTAPIGLGLLKFRDAYREFTAQLQAVERLVDCKSSLCGEPQEAGAISNEALPQTDEM